MFLLELYHDGKLEFPKLKETTLQPHAYNFIDKYNPLGANTRKPNISGLHRGEFCLSGEINDRSFRGLLQDSLPVCFRELSSLS